MDHAVPGGGGGSPPFVTDVSGVGRARSPPGRGASRRAGSDPPHLRSTAMAPYGSWSTPVTSELVVQAAAGLGGVTVDGDTVTWSEQRPEEGGRTQLVQRTGDGPRSTCCPPGSTPAPRSTSTAAARGGCAGRTVWFANWDDQRLYRLDRQGDARAGHARARGARAATAGPTATSTRAAAGCSSCASTTRRAAARPTWSTRSSSLDADRRARPRGSLVTGPDFVSDPRISPDGARLCWLQWSHPDMPWDGTELCVADLRATEVGPALAHPEVVAGRPDAAPGGHGDGESVEPAPVGRRRLAVVHLRPHGLVEPVPLGATGRATACRGRRRADGPMDAEIGVPPVGLRPVALRRSCRDGRDRASPTAATGSTTSRCGCPTARSPTWTCRTRRSARCRPSGRPASCSWRRRPTAEPARGVGARSTTRARPGEPEVLRPPRDLGVDAGWFSAPEPITFPTSGGRTAHALVLPADQPRGDAARRASARRCS